MIADAVIGRDTLGDPKKVSALVRQTLESKEAIHKVAKELSDRTDFYFVARGSHYAVAQEGALKLKELSYIHAEGMPASELKHGTLALIEKGTPVVVIAHSGEGFNSTISNAMELQARGAEIIGILRQGASGLQAHDRIPAAGDSVAPILEVIPLQMLAYFMATERKNDRTTRGTWPSQSP